MKIDDKISKISDFQALIDVMPLPVFIVNRDHQVVLLNDASCEFFGYSREVVLSTDTHELVSAEELEVFHAVDNHVFETGELSENEETVTDASGRTHTVITRKRRVRLNDVAYIVATVTDVTAYREAEAHNHYLAFHDVLTGLPNRSLLNERVGQALLRLQRAAEPCSMLYIDLDRFKEVNDTHGHQAGDALIQMFASRLSSIVRASDTVSRLGGDEFAVLLTDRGEQSDVDKVCQRILDAAAEPFDLERGQAFVNASVGVAEAAADMSAVELQRRADVALYQAKREGRGCSRSYTRELDEHIRHLRRIEHDLREALATGAEFEVYYQPLFATASETIAGMEALVRWNHPELGKLQPDEFVPVAEETGLIVQLGEWVLETACSMMARWPHLTLAVNLSPAQLRDEALEDKIFMILERTGFDLANLELELTEGAILETSETVRDRLKRLRSAGIRIVLDDFGTGYSSLTHLQKLEIDKVKIDKSFVHDIGTGKESKAIVQAVATLARVLGIPVTAEGVETERQHDLLRLIGCTEMQGFLYSRPLSSTDAMQFLKDKKTRRPDVA